MRMKKILLTMVTLASTIMVVAQSVQAPASNAVLVSQSRSGDVITSHYKIPHNDGKHAEFDLHYAINGAKINPSYSDNSNQINELKEFMGQTKDTTMHISAIHIVGYASPDGNAKQNDTLASQRAQSLYQYAISTYRPKQQIVTRHKALHWVDCVSAVEKSDIPQKSAVLTILKAANSSEAQKESALRKMPDAWRYLVTNILPQMRYADIEFDYGVDEYITRTTIVEQTKPAQPVQVAQPQQPEEVVVDEEVGIIIATPRHESKGKSDRHHERKSRKSKKKAAKSGYEVIYW